MRRPKALKYKQLRRLVDEMLKSNLGFQDTDHPEKHPNLNLADALLSLREQWSDLEHKWDSNRKTWKYVIKTRGMDDRRLTTVFIPWKEQNVIEIISRHQDEYAEKYRAPRAPVQKK